MTTLEIERLVLRAWREDALDALATLNADPEVMRYILDGSVRVMAKLGLSHEFDTVVPKHDQPVAVHALARGTAR